MSKHELILNTKDNPDARAAAQEVGENLGFKVVKPFRFKTGRSWVSFALNKKGEPEAAIRVEPDINGEMLEKRTLSVETIKELYERGAPVENHLIIPRQIGLYAVTATEYLPGSYTTTSDFTPYGEALARFHNTSLNSLEDRLTPFEPLAVTQNTFKGLQELRENETLPRLGDTVFNEELVDSFERILKEGEAATEELIEHTEKIGQPPALLHKDITLWNAMIDKNGNTVFIDLNRFNTGPAAYDFGRPIGQWWRFKGRSPQLAEDMLKGYRNVSANEISDAQLDLAERIAYARYATTLMNRVVAAAKQGKPQDEYLIKESINRISGNDRWYSEEEHIRARMKSS